MNRFKFLIVISVCLVVCSANAQSASVVWDKYFGGQNGEAMSIAKTSDGGYIVAGTAQNPHEEAVGFVNGPDVLVVKVNAQFEREWSFCYGGQYFDSPSKIIQTSDGGYLFSATKATETQGFNAWIVKLDQAGAVSWDYDYGGSLEDWSSSVAETPTGQFAVSGWSRSSDGDLTANKGYSDYWLLTLNADGSLAGSRNYGGNDNDFATTIAVNDDGTIVMAGETFSESHDVTCRNPGICESDFWIVKTTAAGDMVWAKCFGSTYSGTNFTNRPKSLIKTADGGYAVVGSGYDNNAEQSQGLADFWVIKIDAAGNLQWKKNFGGPDADIANSIRQTADGGYIVAGSTMSHSGQVTIDFSAFYLSSGRNGWIVKLDAAGTLEWEKAVGSDIGYDYLNDIIEESDGNYIAVGKAGSANHDCQNSDGRQFWILRIAESELGVSNPDRAGISAYPNPVTDKLFFEAADAVRKVAIFETSGRLVYSLQSDRISETDLSDLASGVYLVRLETDGGAAVIRIVKN